MEKTGDSRLLHHTGDNNNELIQNYGTTDRFTTGSQIKSIETSGDQARKEIKMKVNINCIGVVLFVIAAIVCLYFGLMLPKEVKPNEYFTSHLKMVNLFIRHGDRGPSDALPKGDRHIENPALFWPNGLTNLTDLGKFRSFRLGLETRRQYDKFLGFDSDSILAFTSPVYRCRESLKNFLEGLYNIEQAKGRNKRMTNCTSCLPTGSGSPEEWKKVKMDTSTIPALVFEYLNSCPYRKSNPSPLDLDLMSDANISSIVGVNVLKETLKKRYDQDFNFFVLSLWSTILSEMNIVRTQSTIEFTKHYSDWVDQVVYSKDGCKATLFDIHEQVAVIGYRDRVAGVANYIQTGTILTSILESQKMSLNMSLPVRPQAQIYANKKMIVYSSHDSILQLLLNTLGLINIDSSFEKRCKKWQNSNDDLGKFLDGLKMSSYGLSIRFELWENEYKHSNITSHHVQVSIYNREDGRFDPVEYRPVEFGTACRRLFMKKYPNSKDDLQKFYQPDVAIDRRYSCPFKLLLNVTSDLMVEDSKLNELCSSK